LALLRFARVSLHDTRAASLPLFLKPKDILMTIKVGDHLPEATFRLITSDGPRPTTTTEFFKGKKIVLFGLPGAFTPTCHKNHLPGFITHEAAIKAKGVEAIAMTSVNDPFVLAAWAKASGADGKISFLSDGNADFAKAAGLEFDASASGLGLRSKRYSMLVEDGIVKKLNIEESPGKADTSSAEHLLEQL
jgi:peroxiredoxin